MTKSKITTSSTAEYFAKNLQQVGFSSPTKAVLTTLKEAVDNSLDACEVANILPELNIQIKKVGRGSGRNTDLVELIIEDNGPGLELEELPKVFGEYLASSKFGRGQCSRGQQGIGISASVTWAQLTNAKGVTVTSKTKRMRKAVKALINVNIKGNKGIIKKKDTVDWNKPHGVKVEFRIDGRIQLNGDGGLLTYLEGTTLVNPHLNINYKLLENDWVKIARVSDDIPKVPPATLPHPHTMKLGEFISHAHLYDNTPFSGFLKKGFSRVTDQTIKAFVSAGLPKDVLKKRVIQLSQDQYKSCFQAIQNTDLMNPSTRSVLTIGEASLAKSIGRLGEVDFMSVVTRKPKICDFKPVVVEVALARFVNRGEADDPVQLLRFANRVPLQFDKGGCAITRALESVNWRSYGLVQPKRSLPMGPYVFAISVTSPFIKFKNASKETIDSSDELVEEIRRALMQAGQKLSRHIRREHKESQLEKKMAHIEKFGPILIEILGRISNASEKRTKKAEEGLAKLLGRDTKEAKQELEEAKTRLDVLKTKEAKKRGTFKKANNEEESESTEAADEQNEIDTADVETASESSAASAKTTSKKTAKKSTAKKTKKATAKKKTTKTAAKKTAKKAKKTTARKTKAKKTAKKLDAATRHKD